MTQFNHTTQEDARYGCGMVSVANALMLEGYINPFRDAAAGTISHPKGSRVEVRKRKTTAVDGHEVWTGRYEYHITKYGKKGVEKQLLRTYLHPSTFLEEIE